MNSPIIIFNPSGLNEDQVKQVKQALDDAYRAGYETAKEFYQLKLTEPTKNPSHNTLQWNGQHYGIEMNNCSHDGSFSGGKTYADTKGTYADTSNSITNIANGYAVTNDITGLSQEVLRRYCDHMYVTKANKDNGICGKCGISFDEWHG